MAFGVAYLAHRHILLYLADIVIDTRGQLYFPACFHVFWGLYAQQLTLIGLFILKFDRRHKTHDLGQLAVLVITSLACVQYHAYLTRHFEPLVRHPEGALVRPPTTNTVTVTTAAAAASSMLEPFPSPVVRPRFRVPTPSRCSFLGGEATVWLPRDDHGIVQALVDHVRTTCLSPTADAVTITDVGASIAENGQITLHEDGERERPSRECHVRGSSRAMLAFVDDKRRDA